MKSRYKKHLKRIEKNSPLIAFSVNDIYSRNDILKRNELNEFDKHTGLDKSEAYSPAYKLIKQDMQSNLILFMDNYLMCGGHEYIFLLIPYKNDTYKIVEKESINKWAEAYWKREDPLNKRKWSYIDEDINDLFDYMIEKFNKHKKKKHREN